MTFYVFCVEYGPGYGITTVIVEEGALKHSGGPTDFFKPGWTDWEDKGTFDADGPGADFLTDYFHDG